MDTLLNWLWQGMLLAAVAAALLQMVSRGDARLRLLVCWTAIGALAVLPAVPVLLALMPAEVPLLDTAEPLHVPLALPVLANGRLLLVLWGAWILCAVARLLVAAVRVRRARTAGSPLPDARQGRLRHWSRVRQAGRQATVIVSDRVLAASVLGIGSPVIAVAADLLDQLTDEQLDLIVLHEWAHVQRRDDVGHAVQLLVQAVLGWHPAACWMDRRLHLERESAADRLAASTGGCSRAYAAALAGLASLHSRGPRLPVPGAGTSRLRHRITRVLAPPDPAPPWHVRIVRPVAVVAVVLVGIGVGGVRLLTMRHADVRPPGTIAPMIVSSPEASVSTGPGFHAAAPAPRAAQSRRPRAAPLRESPPGGAVQAVPALVDASTAMRVWADAIPYLPGSRAPEVPHIDVSWAALESRPPAGAERAPALASAWGAAADRGVAVGRTTRRAASATAGFFTTFGTKVAEAF